MWKTRILSIDGGGMKGIVSAIVMERVEQLFQYYMKDATIRIADVFDMIGGTSTGAIMTALYLCPDEKGRPKYSAKEVTNLYVEFGNAIFRKREFYPLNTLFGILAPKYKTKKFKELLDTFIGEVTLAQLVKPCMITSYNTYERRTEFFSTLSSKKSVVGELKVKDLVLASTAAPTYFPPMQITQEGLKNCAFIDGGVTVNNPALCMLVEALKLEKCNTINEMMVMSVGNVFNPKPYKYKEVKKWGVGGWAVPILDILLDGGEETVNYQLAKIFDSLKIPENFFRIDYRVYDSVPKMDDASKEAIKIVQQYGQELVLTKDREIKAFVKSMIPSNEPGKRLCVCENKKNPK